MYRILLADDERKIRETLAAYLGAKGFSVRTCADGREAADAAVDLRTTSGASRRISRGSLFG